ncbi:MAG: YggT family protein [Methylophaga sp.]|nr:YggT family protein [Methylophaga sp.]
MSEGYLSNPLIFIIDTLFFLYMIVVALRLLMPWIHWPSNQPLTQMVNRATQPVVQPMRKVLPAIGKLDTAVLVLLIAVALLKLILISALLGNVPNILALIPFTLAEVFKLFITLFTVTIVIEVILSWLTPAGNYNPMTELLVRLNAPLLNPVRRMLPDMGGIDLSPLIVIIGLQVLQMLVVPLLTGSV